MWQWTLNWNEITARLLVGSCPQTPRDLEIIQRESQATALLCLQEDSCFRYWDIDYHGLMRKKGGELGLSMVHSPMRDFDIREQRRSVEKAVRKLAELQNEGHRTYVHCTAGLGRAPLTVLTYLSLVEKHGPERAIRMLKQARNEVVPSWEAYHGFVHDMTERYRVEIENQAYRLWKGGSNDGPETDWARAQIEILGNRLAG